MHKLILLQYKRLHWKSWQQVVYKMIDMTDAICSNTKWLIGNTK